MIERRRYDLWVPAIQISFLAAVLLLFYFQMLAFTGQTSRGFVADRDQNASGQGILSWHFI